MASNCGVWEKAIADFTKIIELNPDDAIAYYNRGMAYSFLQNYSNAIADYNQAIELKPDYANAYYNRGMAYKNLQDYQSAIADLKEAERLFCSSESPNCQKVQEILRQL
jgi:tetratricopeptide (TPR) repeat protein